ncbi:MAG: hypothetical protein Q7J66_16685 [Hydrogenophaga sp.]|nr:hypothetical protein [Hydrogenophaga sp.]
MSQMVDGAVNHHKAPGFLSGRDGTSKNLWLQVKSEASAILCGAGHGQHQVLPMVSLVLPFPTPHMPPSLLASASDAAGCEAMLSRLQDFLSDDQAVLAIGCGTGTTALRLAPLWRKIPP